MPRPDFNPPIDIAAHREVSSVKDQDPRPFSALTSKVQEAIKRLLEYRTALISAAVTGKMDVRASIPADLDCSEATASLGGERR